MSFKSLLGCFLTLWFIYYIFLCISVISTVGKFNVVKTVNVTMRTAGAFGLVKHYYIEPVSALQVGSTPVIERVYGGFSLARILLPKHAINESKTVTYYALPSAGKVIHFAATKGGEKASGVRLYIDTLSYIINKYFILHLGFILLWAFSSTIYASINKTKDVMAEVTSTDKQPLIRSIQLLLLCSAFILVFV